MNEEPQVAGQYDDRTTAAIRSVLVEIGQTLGSYRGKFAVVGGAVPWLLLEESEMRHVGTADIDLSLDAEALAEDEQYAGLVEALRDQGYESREELRNFRMVRTVEAKDGGATIEVVVDRLVIKEGIESRLADSIETALRLQTPIVILIWTDAEYGLITWHQLRHFGRASHTTFGNPDFVRYAESFGAKGYRIDSAAALLPTLRQALQDDTVSVIDCPVDYAENMLLTHRLETLTSPM